MNEVVDQLRTFRVEYLVDVRSVPYSRYRPSFSRKALARYLRSAGIRYEHMGAQLGGRPADPSCYDHKGRILYERVCAKPFFQEGVALLQDACRRGFTVCLLCAEADPARCHRSGLIGVALEQVGIHVEHLLRCGGSKGQDEVMTGPGEDQLGMSQ